MSDVTLTLSPVHQCGKPAGIVAYLRLPIPLAAMRSMGSFLSAAYGPDATVSEEPKGWLRIETARDESTDAQGVGR